MPVPPRPAPTAAERNSAAGDGHAPDGNGAAGDGHAPDLADALAMAFMRPPSLQIWTGNEPFLRAARNGAAVNGVGVPVPQRPAPNGAERNGAAGDGHGADGNDADAAPAPAGAGSPSPYKGRGGREAAREGTGDAPPSDAPASPDPADVPLDRFFIRF